ncbi:2TM domain-containing protein [Kaistella sp. DKR-2]|uniref:2TM domain-containing protein n=1 Tax=Kaistella soli TaxID=2849654 RepID=UPI001C278E01|nr:2TM domain-containing protein [Kaistella soli]MBU8883753.1 2TM domain-containing protein [Kaistella soli]
MENSTEIKYRNAAERVARLKKFYGSLFLFLIIFCAVTLYRFYKTGDFFYSSGVSVIFVIWAIILTVKSVKLFFLNAEWENDMIKKELKNQHDANQ